VTLEYNTDAIFAKLSKMNKIQYNSAYSVQLVTSYYSAKMASVLYSSVSSLHMIHKLG